MLVVILGMCPGHPWWWFTAPYTPAMMSPFLQHRWSSLKIPAVPSASQQKLLILDSQALVKMADTPHVHKGELCHLSEAQEQLRVLWRVSSPTGCWTDRQTLSRSPVPLGLSQENVNHFSFLSSSLNTEDLILNSQ